MIFAAVKQSFDLQEMINSLILHGTSLGLTLIKAFFIFVIGKMLIKLIRKLIRKVMNKRNIELSIKTFVESLVNVILTILLIVAVVGALGVETTSFAALLASAGVAIGMALSGNLANFAGGLIILLFKPYKVGDFIEGQGVSGTVKEIQIFHSVLSTPDNKIVYVPNGSLSSGAVTNYSREDKRRVDWTFGVEYGQDFEKVKSIIEGIIAKDSRILQEPAPFVALTALADSSVNIVVRVWVESPNFWPVYFEINQQVYATFNSEGISFPFPQLTIHRAND